MLGDQIVGYCLFNVFLKVPLYAPSAQPALIFGYRNKAFSNTKTPPSENSCYRSIGDAEIGRIKKNISSKGKKS